VLLNKSTDCQISKHLSQYPRKHVGQQLIDYWHFQQITFHTQALQFWTLCCICWASCV